MGQRAGMSRNRALDRAPEHDGEVPVEPVTCFLREVVSLAGPGDRVGEGADPDGECERLAEAAAPRLQVGIAQPLDFWASYRPTSLRTRVGRPFPASSLGVRSHAGMLSLACEDRVREQAKRTIRDRGVPSDWENVTLPLAVACRPAACSRPARLRARHGAGTGVRRRRRAPRRCSPGGREPPSGADIRSLGTVPP